MARRIKIDESLRGKRADIVAVEAFPKLSRAYIHTLFDAKRIMLNHEEVKPGHKLREGDVLNIDFDEAELEQIPHIDLPVLYEDEAVLVVNKPVGVISHSRGKYWNEPSVASFVRERTGQEGERAGIVHRLDRATSGVMICTKNNETLRFLQKQFSARNVHKTYMAIVDGHIDPPEAIIDMPIERNPKAPATFRVGSNGKPSVTHYKVLESSKSHDLVELKPTTGRTHQLRVHLRQLGHPITGDVLYDGSQYERLLLHAFSLEITVPGGDRRVFTAPLPPAFESLLRSDA
jgi:23S rRNA pseudouridine1911/1915/1917 synthase